MTAVNHYILRSPDADVFLTYDDAVFLGTRSDGAKTWQISSITMEKRTVRRMQGSIICKPLVAVTFDSTAAINRTIAILPGNFLDEFSCEVRVS